MIKLMQFVALTAVLGCCLPTMITAQDWSPAQCCPRGEKAVGFQLFFEKNQKRTIVVIVIICTHGSRIFSPPGPTPGSRGFPGDVHTCRPGKYLTSCQLQLERSGVNTPANNLNCRCNDGQTLFGDGHHIGIWQGWSPRCPNGIVGIQTFAGKTPHPFYIYDARFPCTCPRVTDTETEIETEIDE